MNKAIKKAIAQSKRTGEVERISITDDDLCEWKRESTDAVVFKPMQECVGGGESYCVSTDDWEIMVSVEPFFLVRARVTDLHNDGCGWSENASRVHEVTLKFPQDTSDRTVVRKIKSALLITGMKKDGWCQSDFGPWRAGCIGAYADIEENS